MISSRFKTFRSFFPLQTFSRGIFGTKPFALRVSTVASRYDEFPSHRIRFYHLSNLLYGEIIEVEGPSFAESITEGDIRWIKKKGDFVNVDELLAEIETDKTSVEVPAQYSGVIVELLAEDGAKVTAKQKLYKIEKSDQPPDILVASKKTEDFPKQDSTFEKAPSSTQEQKSTPTDKASPKLEEVEKPRSKKAHLISSTPVSEIKPQSVASSILSPTDSSQQITGLRDETRVKMSRMRQRIAMRLKEAQNTNAMLTTFNEIDLTNVIEMRKKYQDLFTKKHGIKLSLMSPFIRASVIALQEQPVVNAVIENSEIVYRQFVDISIAVATPKGLVVPIMRNVETMGFAQIEKSMAELGTKARDGKLAIEDMEGGTFTISNGGVFGSMFGTPIINPPQSAILGMHAIFDRVVAINGKVEIRPMMYVALTYDHRLIDGREAVTFLRKIKQVVEDPVSSLLDL